MAKSSVRSSHPDEEVGEVAEGGVGAGSAVKASISSAMALSLPACTLTMPIRNSRLADRSGKGSWACAKCLCNADMSCKLFLETWTFPRHEPLPYRRSLDSQQWRSKEFTGHAHLVAEPGKDLFGTKWNEKITFQREEKRVTYRSRNAIFFNVKPNAINVISHLDKNNIT